MQELHRERSIVSGPGLHALVIYLRPSRRTPLLSVLSELGVFVVECVGNRWRKAHAAWPSDLALVVADCSPEHLQVVTEVAEQTGRPVLCVASNGDQFASFVRAGASACVSDDDDRPSLVAHIESVARLARRNKELPREAGREDLAAFIVFDDVRFHLNPPFLAREAKSVSLSLSECDALLALTESLGSPVATETIEERLGRRSAPVSPGYTKTIMLRIRRKVDSIGGDSAVLGAVRNFGYVLRG